MRTYYITDADAPWKTAIPHSDSETIEAARLIHHHAMVEWAACGRYHGVTETLETGRLFDHGWGRVALSVTAS